MSLPLPPPIIPPSVGESCPPLHTSSTLVVPLVPVVFSSPCEVVIPPLQPVVTVDVSNVTRGLTDRDTSGPVATETEQISRSSVRSLQDHEGKLLHTQCTTVNKETMKSGSLAHPVVSYPSLATLFQPYPVQGGTEAYRGVQSISPPHEMELSSCTSSIALADEPKYIVFGGARYNRNHGTSSSERLVESLSAKNERFSSVASEGKKKVDTDLGVGSEVSRQARKHVHKTTKGVQADDKKKKEMLRIKNSNSRRRDFLSDQLNIGYTYLNMQHKPSSSFSVKTDAHCESVLVPGAIVRATASGVVISDARGSDSSIEMISKLNWWTLAICGSPSQLLERLNSAQGGKSTLIDSVGYVHLNRRLWGLKKSGDTYSLGFGTKATALQFAAVMERFDNVLFLVLHRAKDTPPLLKDLVSESAYSMICRSYYNSQLSSGTGERQTEQGK